MLTTSGSMPLHARLQWAALLVKPFNFHPISKILMSLCSLISWLSSHVWAMTVLHAQGGRREHRDYSRWPASLLACLAANKKNPLASGQPQYSSASHFTVLQTQKKIVNSIHSQCTALTHCSLRLFSD